MEIDQQADDFEEEKTQQEQYANRSQRSQRGRTIRNNFEQKQPQTTIVINKNLDKKEENEYLNLLQDTITLSKAEGLSAHALSATYRLNKLKD